MGRGLLPLDERACLAAAKAKCRKLKAEQVPAAFRFPHAAFRSVCKARCNFNPRP
jgi:hypothetical protein